MTKKLHIRLLIVLSILVSTTLACNLPALSEPTLVPTPQTLTSEDVQALEQQIQATLTSPDANGNVSLTLTQAQLNAVVAYEMAQQKDQVITNPSVALNAGQMEVSGKVNQSGISADVKVVLQPSVDENGNARLNVTSINLAGIPVPDVLKGQIETAADDAMNRTFSDTTGGLKATSITIGDGQVTFTGTHQ